jgi:hypothetical protein
MIARVLLLAASALACALCVAPAFSKPVSPPGPPNEQNRAVLQTGMQPGQYHNTMTFEDVTGLPPAVARRMMSRAHTSDGCLRTSDINSVIDDAIAGGADMTCSQAHGSAAGGVISGGASCHDSMGNSGTLTISGTYTATHADVSGDLSAQTQIGPISEHIHLVSDRTGACSS